MFFCQYYENDSAINPIIYTKQKDNKMLSNSKKFICLFFFNCTKCVRTFATPGNAHMYSRPDFSHFGVPNENNLESILI